MALKAIQPDRTPPRLRGDAGPRCALVVWPARLPNRRALRFALHPESIRINRQATLNRSRYVSTYRVFLNLLFTLGQLQTAPRALLRPAHV